MRAGATLPHRNLCPCAPHICGFSRSAELLVHRTMSDGENPPLPRLVRSPDLDEAAQDAVNDRLRGDRKGITSGLVMCAWNSQYEVNEAYRRYNARVSRHPYATKAGACTGRDAPGMSSSFASDMRKYSWKFEKVQELCYE
jgi:hypothetical protein